MVERTWTQGMRGRSSGVSNTGRRIQDGWFRSLVEQSLVGVYVVQGDRFIYVNPRFAEMFGYSVEEIITRCTIRDLVAPEDLATVEENIRLRMTGQVRSIRYTFRGRPRSGEDLVVEVHGSRTRYRGRPAVVGVMVDVTGERRAARERESALAQLREAVRARDELIALVSHDLRNPLHSILLSAELLLTASDVEPSQREWLERIRRLGRGMEGLIRDLLDVSAMEAGSLRVNPAPVPLAAVIASAVDLLQPIAAQKGVAMEVTTGDSLPPVLADHDRLVQVFSNLCGNSLKFVGAGGQIRISATEHDGSARVSIADDGPGISAENLPHLFDRFWTSGEGGGSGLGLAIARGIVEAHGGHIAVDSDAGSGCTVSFTIPFAA